VLAPESGHPLLIFDRLRIGELTLYLGGALDRVRETIPEAQLSVEAGAPGLRYFWRNRSTRPAVSTSFCLPVKKGWQAAQMSVWISACVERVRYVLPQAHFTVAVA
jgi:hypothetical protein